MKAKKRKGEDFKGYSVFEYWNKEHTKGGSPTVGGTSGPDEAYQIYCNESAANRRCKFLNDNCGNDGPRWKVQSVLIKVTEQPKRRGKC